MEAITATIRTAGLSDVPAVAELCAQWAAEDLTRNYRADSPAELTGRLGEWFLVAESSKEIVGFVVGQVKPTRGDTFVEGVLDDNDVYLEVQDLYVASPHRGRGIGTRLMQEILGRAARAGVTGSLVYSANRDYVRTARFYEGLGYDIWHIVMTRKE